MVDSNNFHSKSIVGNRYDNGYPGVPVKAHSDSLVLIGDYEHGPHVDFNSAGLVYFQLKAVCRVYSKIDVHCSSPALTEPKRIRPARSWWGLDRRHTKTIIALDVKYMKYGYIDLYVVYVVDSKF